MSGHQSLNSTNTSLASRLPEISPQTPCDYGESNCLERRWMESHFQQFAPPPCPQPYSSQRQLLSKWAYWPAQHKKEKSLRKREEVKLEAGRHRPDNSQMPHHIHKTWGRSQVIGMKQSPHQVSGRNKVNTFGFQTVSHPSFLIVEFPLPSC